MSAKGKKELVTSVVDSGGFAANQKRKKTGGNLVRVKQSS